jgi:hypothetical protein
MMFELAKPLKFKVQSTSWDENWDAIPAFAAFCREGSHQGMSVAEAYTPYAVLRRCGDDVSIEIVGQMLRP